MRLPNELVEAARNNNLVIWVGAGLSWNFNNQSCNQIQGWNNLTKHITNSFPEESYLTSMLMKSAISRGDNPLEVLDIFEILSNLPKSEIANYVKHFYSVSDFDREWLIENSSKRIITKSEGKKIIKDFYILSEEQKDWSLHEDLCKLSNIIVTTNYDNAFEITCKRTNRSLKTFIIYKVTVSQEFNVLQQTTLVKLHGSVSDEDTMVIFPEDYAYLYEHQAHSLISELKKLIFSKSILFIGCGMGDWQINHIFKFAKDKLADLNQKHFIIALEDEYKNIKKEVGNFLELIPINKFPPAPDINNIITDLIKEKAKITQKIEFDFCSQANEIFDKAIFLKDENLLEQCCELYKKAAESLNSRNDEVFYKWGIALLELAKLRKSEILYKDSIEKFDIITDVLNPYKEEAFLYRKIARNGLETIDIEEVINNNTTKFKTLIPVKVCVGKTNTYMELSLDFCGCVNSCGRTTCKRCGKPLGKEWNDYGHISAAVCKKCGKYIGSMGSACPTCGENVPFSYKEFIE